MKYLKYYLISFFMFVGACGSADIESSSQVFSSSAPDKELCDSYSGTWRLQVDGESPENRSKLDEMTIRGFIDPASGLCRFEVVKSNEFKLVFSMDNQPHKIVFSQAPVTLASYWTSKGDLKSLLESEDSNHASIGFKLQMVGQVGATKFDLLTEGNLVLEAHNKLRLQSITRTNLTVNGEVDSSQPAERVDEFYSRVKAAK